MEKNPAMEITMEDIRQYREGYRGDALRQAMSAGMAQTDIGKLICAPDRTRLLSFHFSHEIPTMKALSQEQSGRCWLFAATNVLREHLARELNLEEAELSQSWFAFWDKFERCGYFLKAVREMADRPFDDRTLQYVMHDGGVPDGGQWDMFTGLVAKYGIVPKDAMPETYQSSHTKESNRIISSYLRKSALRMRELVCSAAPEEEVRAFEREVLQKCWSFLASAYGEPPEVFDFAYTDKEKVYHRVSSPTPLEFRDRYFAGFWDDFVCLINAPTKDKPYGRTYTVQYLGNIAESEGVRYLNLPMEEIKAMILRQLMDGEIVWFGSDCGKYASRDNAFWDDASFQTQLLSGMDTSMSKAGVLDTADGRMNHAMCLTGVNIAEDGRPDRWKIENSWGSGGPHEGYFIASDSWFDRCVFQAAVHKRYLGEKLALFDEEPVVLPPWDPMGALAD